MGTLTFPAEAEILKFPSRFHKLLYQRKIQVKQDGSKKQKQQIRFKRMHERLALIGFETDGTNKTT